MLSILQTKDGNPLHCACMRLKFKEVNVTIVLILIREGVNINALDRNEKNAFHNIVSCGENQFTKKIRNILLESGVDPNALCIIPCRGGLGTTLHQTVIG